MRRALGLTVVAAGFVACAGAAKPAPSGTTVAERPVQVPTAPSAAAPAEALPACSDADAGVRAFSADGGTLAVARGTTAVVYRTSDWKQQSSVDVGLPIRRLTLSRNYLVVIGAEDPPATGTLMVAQARDGKVLLEREHVPSPISRHEKAAISPDERWLALATPDAPRDPDSDDSVTEHVEILELPSLAQRGTFTQPATVTTLPHPKWHPRKLPRPAPPGASGPMGPMMMGYANSPVPNSPPDWTLDKLEPEQHGVLDVLPAASSRTLMIEWAEGAVSLVDAQTGKPLATVLVLSSGGGMWRHALSPSGRFAVLSRASNAVAVFDLDTQQGRLFYDPLCAGSSGPASFDHKEDAAVLSGWSFATCVIDLKSAKLRTLLPPKPPAHGAFEDEGLRSGGPWRADDGGVVVQDMAGQAVLWDLATKTGTPVAVDGRTARSTETRVKDGSLVFFDELGKPMAELVGSKLSYLPIADSDGLASAVSPDAELVLWGLVPPLTLLSARDGKPRATLKDPPKVGIYGFDPSSRFVYTTDEALFVWRADSGALAYRDPPRCTSSHKDDSSAR